MHQFALHEQQQGITIVIHHCVASMLLCVQQQFSSLCARQTDLTSLQAIVAKRFIEMLDAAYTDLIGQPLSSAAESGSASLTALAHRVAT